MLSYWSYLHARTNWTLSLAQTGAPSCTGDPGSHWWSKIIPGMWVCLRWWITESYIPWHQRCEKKGPGPCALFFLAQTFGPSLDVFLATLVTTRLSMSTGWASPWFFRFITPLNLQVVVLVGQEIIMPILQVMIITLWLFNIAMGNGP